MSKVYRSGRTREQFIRTAVIEDDAVYVPPPLFALMREVYGDMSLDDAGRATKLGSLLGLTSDEWITGRLRGFRVVVDYEMSN